MQKNLTARQPFIFHTTVRSHGWWQLVPFHYMETTGLLTYILRLSSGKVVDLHIREAPGGVSVETATLTQSEQDELICLITWMLDLDRDLSAFYAVARREPKLAHVEQKACGRVLRSPTFFEDVVRTILTTNTLWAATKRMTTNLVDQFGESLKTDASQKAFPTPNRLAAATEAQLRIETRLGYRAPYILELAQRESSGELNLEAYKTSNLPTLQMRKELMKIKGIGAYAAANLLMLLGRSDFIPLDSWALKMVSHEWYDGQPVTPAQVEAAFEKWAEFKGLAYWFWNWSYTGS